MSNTAELILYVNCQNSCRQSFRKYRNVQGNYTWSSYTSTKSPPAKFSAGRWFTRRRMNSCPPCPKNFMSSMSQKFYVQKAREANDAKQMNCTFGLYLLYPVPAAYSCGTPFPNDIHTFLLSSSHSQQLHLNTPIRATLHKSAQGTNKQVWKSDI